MTRLILVAMLAGAATPAFAADQKQSEDRVICKTQASTGSRIARGKDCRPASEWRAIEEAHKKSAQGLFDSISSRSSQMPVNMDRVGRVN